MRRTMSVVCCVVAASLLVVSCGSNSSSEDPAAAQQSISLPVDAPRITLTNPGSGEQQVLAFSGAPEQSVPVTVTSGFRQQTLAGDDAATLSESPESPSGAVDSTFSSTVSVAAGQGEEEDVVLTFNDLNAGKEDMSSASGFTMAWDRTKSGQVSMVRFGAPTGATDEARAVVERQAMRMLSLPVVFPADAVGVGAQWTVDSRVAGESAMLQTLTYTLTSVKDSTVELDVSVEQRPTVGAIPIDGGGELKVLSSRTASAGHLRLDLSQALPPAGNVEFTTRVIHGQDDSPTRVTQDSSTALTFGNP